MINTVIFDMDGVLLDTEKYLVKYWCQAAREFGFDMKPEHGLMIRSLASKFAEPKLKALFGETFDYKQIQLRRKELMKEQIRKEGIEKKPGVDKVLSYLQDNSYKTAVATATDQERAEEYLKTAGIYDKFNKVVCAPMVENGKPEPDIYIYACETMGERPEACMAIEDSPNGVRSAFQAGCKTVMIPDLTPAEEDTKPMLYGLADHMDDLIPILEKERMFAQIMDRR